MANRKPKSLVLKEDEKWCGGCITILKTSLFGKGGGRDGLATCCKICKGKRDLDHDHLTGMIRGLICHGCNAILGFSKESKIRLEGCVKYLNNWNKTRKI